jgi:tripartite-type tricarboxylate transporter receptor subunit TctC
MTNIDRRALGRGALTLAGTLAMPGVVRAQAWPVSQVTFVVPFPPGGTVDPLARLAQPLVQAKLGTTVIVENKPGAAGSIGANQVAKAKPDGSQFVFVFDTHAVNPALQTLPFDTEKDLEPVLLIGTCPHVLVTHPSRPFQSFADVIAAAKKDPGKLNYGSIETGSMGHLTTVLLGKRGGFDLTHVPFRGGGPLTNDAVGGHIDLAVASFALFNSQIAGGTLRPLVQTGTTRLPQIATVPTAIEAGFAGFESFAWWGVFATKGTPPDLIERMRATLVEAFNDAAARKQIAEVMMITPILGGPDQLRPWLAQQMKTWGDVIRDNGIKAAG